MVIIDDMVVLAVRHAARPRGSVIRCVPPMKHLETIVEKTHPQPVTDQTRRHSVEDLAQGEAAGAR